MDITEFIFSQREEVLLVGDYNAYRAHASRRLLKLRRKLGQTTPKGRKYAAKSPVSAEDIASNAGYVPHALCKFKEFNCCDTNLCIVKVRTPPASLLRESMGARNAHEVDSRGRPLSKGNCRFCQASYYLTPE